MVGSVGDTLLCDDFVCDVCRRTVFLISGSVISSQSEHVTYNVTRTTRTQKREYVILGAVGGLSTSSYVDMK